MAVQGNGLIANNARRAICRSRIAPVEIHVGFGPRHEERAAPVHRMKAAEIDIAAIHDIDRAGFRGQQVECTDIGHLAVGNIDEAWDVAAQIEQRVHLHGGFGGPEMRPRKHRQAQIDGRRNPTHRRRWSGPDRDPPRHTAASPERSAAAPVRHGCANRAVHWHRPVSSGAPAR